MKSLSLLSVARTCVFGVTGVLLLVSHNAYAWAQEAAILNAPGEPIPERYESWSLFLINNPQWLVPSNKEKIRSLYQEFMAFGKAIGPDHVAVWFWKENETGDHKADYEVDVDRAAVFCAKLKLPPSKGPYVVITSEYPGKGLVADRKTVLPTKLKHVGTLTLNNASAEQISQVLDRAADKIMSGDFSHLDFSSESGWRGAQQAFDGIRDFLASLKISFTVKTPFLEAKVN